MKAQLAPPPDYLTSSLSFNCFFFHLWMSPCLCLSLLPLSPSERLSSSLLQAEARPGSAGILSSLPSPPLVVDGESYIVSFWPLLVQIASLISSVLSLTEIPTPSTTPSYDLLLHRLSPQIPLIIMPETSVLSCLSKSLVASKAASVVLASLKLHEKSLCINSNDLTLKKLRCSSVFNNIFV